MKKSGVWKLIAVLFIFSIALLLYFSRLKPNSLIRFIGRSSQTKQSKQAATDESFEKVESKNEVIKRYDDWFSTDFSTEKRLFESIRYALSEGRQIRELPKLNIDLNPSYAWVAISLFQDGTKPIRWISKRNTPVETLNRIIFKLRENERFSSFEVSEPNKCRIMLEVITKEQPVDVKELTTTVFNDSRFEPGITGFKLEYNSRDYVYMPTDATVYSHLTLRHALNHLSKKIGIARKTNKISERIKLLKGLPIEWTIIESVAFVTYGKEVIPLYRGYPMPVEFSSERIFEMAEDSSDWVLANMYEDGRFLYYYDGVKDTVIDHIHPNRSLEDNYYNILRHNGGIIALLKMYELTKDDRYLTAAKKAIGFLIKQLRRQEYENKTAYYAYFNKKAKLGGSGTALVALMNYYRLTKDGQYNEFIYGLARHILSRVDEDGEMIGYYIHPNFNGGQPILSPTDEEKKQLFSFYYPGEALLGLALFERYMDLPKGERKQIRNTVKRALDFLVNSRPVKYAELFKPLPSDGWLMQAIEQWSYDEEFRKAEYLDFVFSDAIQMISHMYTEQNSVFYDYPGTFYYNYGDHAYPDSARAEGLISAYYLAAKTGRDDLAEKLLENCKMVAEALMLLYNSEESAYMHKYPEKSIGTFRFKFTRQWVRIDTVQHTACFFIRLYKALNQEGTFK